MLTEKTNALLYVFAYEHVCSLVCVCGGQLSRDSRLGIGWIPPSCVFKVDVGQSEVGVRPASRARRRAQRVVLTFSVDCNGSGYVTKERLFLTSFAANHAAGPLTHTGWCPVVSSVNPGTGP